MGAAYSSRSRRANILASPRWRYGRRAGQFLRGRAGGGRVERLGPACNKEPS